jgi:hypothetical protein
MERTVHKQKPPESAKLFWASCILLLSYLPLALHAQSPYRTESAKIFSSNVVATIKIDIAPAFLAYILNPANSQSDSLFPARFIFQNENIAGDTLEPVGFRLRGNTSRTSPKKSFKIDINEYVRGQKFYGLEKLNVNGEHNDPAIMRSRLCWDLFEQAGVPGARATYAAFYINNEYRGLYVLVEHYDENFILDRFGNNDGNLYKCLYPAPLVWRGPDQAAYKYMRNSRERAYDIEINEEQDDYSDLVSFINFLNNTSDADFARELEARFNVRAFLKYLAHNTLLGSWDDYWYLQNNYYLYHNTATDKFEFIPYDYDNTYGIDWVNGDWGTRDIYNFGHPREPRPLVKRILNIPAYRNLYSFYMKEALNGVFTLAAHEPKFARWRALAEPWVQSDPYYPIQWNFTFASWQQSLDVAFGGHVEYGIRPFIQTRSASATQQLQEGPLPAEITEVQWEPGNPAAREDVLVKCRVHDGGAAVTRVDLLYSVAGGPSVLAAMYDDGQHFDGAANDGVWAGKIFGQAPNESIEFYLRAQSSAGAWTIYPETAPFKKIRVYTPAPTYPLVINEFMAQNTRTIMDPADGDWDDWVEIYNAADTAVALNGMFLTDNLASPQKWQFPDTAIAAKSFLLVWTDNEATQGPLHTNFALSRNGEQIGLFAPLALGNVPIDTLSFGVQKADTSFGRTPDRGSTWRFFATPTPGRSNVSTSVLSRDEQRTVPEAFRLEKVWPNPAAKLVNVRLHIVQAGEYEIALFDVLGRRVLQQRYRRAPSGAQDLALPLSGLRAGVYFVRVKLASNVQHAKLLLME